MYFQEKLVQEVMARQLSQPGMLTTTLAGAIYPGLAMPMYAPAAAAMAPIMAVNHMQPQMATRTPESPKSPSSSDDGMLFN